MKTQKTMNKGRAKVKQKFTTYVGAYSFMKYLLNLQEGTKLCKLDF